MIATLRGTTISFVFGVALWVVAFRLAMFISYLFLVGVAIWTVVTVNRMRKDHAIALQSLNELISFLGLQRSRDKIEKGGSISLTREPPRFPPDVGAE